ncbi:MAG: PAS domain-containing protein [Gammaproteobacteria bacterium]|nr:PAS domain-containing protein [Gammaproteobacteria bacterium]
MNTSPTRFWRTLIDQCQQALCQTQDETGFRDKFCQALVATGGYRAAWIVLGDTEQGQPPHIAAQSGLDPQICGNLPCLTLPLGGSIVGTLSLCAGESTAFDEETRAWLELVVQTLSLGIAELRRRAENLQEMEFSAATIQRLMQQVFAVDQHTIISMTDEKGTITYANEKFCEVSQYPYDELIGRNHSIVNSGFHPPAFFAEMWATIRSGNTWSGEICNRRRNGELYWVETTIVPSPAPGGSGYHYVGVRTEITALKQYEDELKTANQQLEQRIEKRTAELQKTMALLEADIDQRCKIETRLQQEQEEQRKLIAELHSTQSQLLQSEKMASIGQLAAGVAHEINNPIGFVHSNLGSMEKYIDNLFAIVSAYEAAEGDYLPGSACLPRLQAIRKQFDLDFLREDIPALLSESRDGITRVKKIVQDLKDFSHVDESERQWSDLHHGLDSTLNIVWNELKYKVEVVKEYGNLPEIECFPSQINQVFMNLFVNAGHAIETRGTLTIRTGAETEQVWVEIADSGKGIAPEHLPRIFEPFFTTKPIGKGTGLGLSLSYGIIQKHHGRIEVESEIGHGTTFRVWLPVRQDKASGQTGQT